MTRVPDLGPRGEGWVVMQFVLFIAFGVVAGVSDPWPARFAPTLALFGAVLIAGGAVLLVLAFRGLGASITAFPKPIEGAELRTGGVYGLSRHPIYGGVLMLAKGWTLVRGPLALIPLVALGALFILKSMREEAFLVERYPAYADYREKVRKRFIPWLI